MIRLIVNFWLRHIHPPLTSLIAAIGIFGLTICIAILFFLAKLSEEVLEKESFAFDQSLLLWIHQFATPRNDRLMLAITQLGNPSFVVIIFIGSVLILGWRRNYQELLVLILAALGAWILNTELKLFFSKPRPELWISLIKETSYSFPSGHALGSSVLYGFLAYLLATRYTRLTILIYTIAILLIATIGFSRLYLGVHWPTDILAGYGVGFLWLMMCITMLNLRKLNRG